MTIAGYVLAGIAALLHVFIFYLESIAWESPQARKVFGTTADEAETTKFLAFNQGFYNLFLAVVTIVGIIFAASGEKTIGATLTITGVGSMLAAAAVLFVASAPHRPAAIRQGAFPLIALILLVIGLSL